MIAILDEEDDAVSLAARLAETRQSISHLWRLRIHDRPCAQKGLSRSRSLKSSISSSISTDAQTLDITAEIGRNAVQAFNAFGRGRHKAALNMGDCFAYACAKAHDLQLLCKGNDFPFTDIEIA